MPLSPICKSQHRPIANSSPITSPIQPDLSADLRRGIETNVGLQGYDHKIYDTSQSRMHYHQSHLMEIASDRVLVLEVTCKNRLNLVKCWNEAGKGEMKR